MKNLIFHILLTTLSLNALAIEPEREAISCPQIALEIMDKQLTSIDREYLRSTFGITLKGLAQSVGMRNNGTLHGYNFESEEQKSADGNSFYVTAGYDVLENGSRQPKELQVLILSPDRRVSAIKFCVFNSRSMPVASAQPTSSAQCIYNIETGRIFDLAAIPIERRIDAYKDYLANSHRCEARPCPAPEAQAISEGVEAAR